MSKQRICILGLGYVGLPLAVAISDHYSTIGYDINIDRIDELKSGYDTTKEVTSDVLKNTKIEFTSDLTEIASANIYIITVPTPVDNANVPDLSALIDATEKVAKFIKSRDIVVYESTVFPGATNEICGPLLEKISGLKCNEDFFLGYSPERINPGDKVHTIDRVTKIVSGSSDWALKQISSVYNSFLGDNICAVSSIEVAETAKIIENIQRDVNIGLMNELAKICNKLGIDTNDVIDAASTKWNFIPFRPGLVGGHCIGVDPYYLTHKAGQLELHPEVILAGRRINEGMAGFCSEQFVKKMILNEQNCSRRKVLILGAAFKENCTDTRNSKVYELAEKINQYGCDVEIFDPIIYQHSNENKHYTMVKIPKSKEYDGIILAVPHNIFIDMGPKGIRSYGKKNSVFFDLKGAFSKNESDMRL